MGFFSSKGNSYVHLSRAKQERFQDTNMIAPSIAQAMAVDRAKMAQNRHKLTQTASGQALYFAAPPP